AMLVSSFSSFSSSLFAPKRIALLQNNKSIFNTAKDNDVHKLAAETARQGEIKRSKSSFFPIRMTLPDSTFTVLQSSLYILCTAHFRQVRNFCSALST